MQQILPTPRTSRELIELFAVYDRQIGINSVLNAADFSVLDRATVLTMALGAVKQQRLEQEVREGYNPRGHLRTLLQSVEFRERARPLIFEAFPEKRRAIFIHIPKCAGTDMTDLLRRQYPALLQSEFMAKDIEPESWFRNLRDIVIGMRYVDTIAAAGHERLAYYQQHQLIRPQDWVFTVVREPTVRVYSHVCFALTMAQKKWATGEPASLAEFGIEDTPDFESPAQMVAAGRKLLYHPMISLHNPICNFLGNGTADSALKRIAQGNVEITDTARYAAWRRHVFPGAGETRANESIAYFSDSVATAGDRAHIAAVTEEDRKLFALIKERLDRAGGLSIRVRETA